MKSSATKSARRWVVRRDRNAIAVFDRLTGTKLRWVFGRRAYDKARVPELVDVKITDYCPFACAFCYQASTVEGSHARWEDLELLVRRFAEARVFEVALGGGEPTDHPDFVPLLWAFCDAGVVPNFTTKSLGWVKRNWSRVEGAVGAFAYSAEKVSDLRAADKMLAGVPRERVNIHYVMGLAGESEFLEFLQVAHELGFRVTLLGYKTVGRGSEVKHSQYDWWIRAVGRLVREGRCPTLSIDTPLAAQYADRLPVGERYFHTREGFVSAYVDAVAMTMAASSFEPAGESVPFDEEWVSRYAGVVPV